MLKADSEKVSYNELWKDMVRKAELESMSYENVVIFCGQKWSLKSPGSKCKEQQFLTQAPNVSCIFDLFLGAFISGCQLYVIHSAMVYSMLGSHSLSLSSKIHWRSAR